VQFQKNLESARDNPPTTLSASWLCLDGLAKCAADVVRHFDSGPENQATGWARALLRQSSALLDELTFLAPWISGGLTALDEIPTLRELVEQADSLPPVEQADSLPLSDALRRSIEDASTRAKQRLAAIEHLAQQCSEFATVEYDFLSDNVSHLLSIGFNAGERRRDSSCYDLLASEARLCSFVAIAQGKVPQENWFALGRLFTSTIAGRRWFPGAAPCSSTSCQNS